MEFFDKKEEVLDLELTPYGRYLFSIGKLKPVYYAFYDDDIIYDPRYFPSGSNISPGMLPEHPNSVQGRVIETPRLRAQGSFRERKINDIATSTELIAGIPGYDTIIELSEISMEHYMNPSTLDDGSPSTVIIPVPYTPPVIEAHTYDPTYRQEEYEKRYSLSSMLGTVDYNNNLMPAWNITFLKGGLQVAENTTTPHHTGSGTTLRIPQLEAKTVTYRPIVGNSPPGPNPNIEDVERTVINFSDGTFLDIREDFLFLEVEEQNTLDERDSFEIEIFERFRYNILPLAGAPDHPLNGTEILKPLLFSKDISQLTEGDVGYHFDIL